MTRPSVAMPAGAASAAASEGAERAALDGRLLLPGGGARPPRAGEAPDPGGHAGGVSLVRLVAAPDPVRRPRTRAPVHAEGGDARGDARAVPQHVPCRSGRPSRAPLPYAPGRPRRPGGRADLGRAPPPPRWSARRSEGRVPGQRALEPSTADAPLWGERDMAPAAEGEAASRRIPRCAFETMAGIGHFPFLEAPSRTAESIRAFLAPFARRMTKGSGCSSPPASTSARAPTRRSGRPAQRHRVPAGAGVAGGAAAAAPLLLGVATAASPRIDPTAIARSLLADSTRSSARHAR